MPDKTPRRDWQLANDIAAHYMDALQRRLIGVEFHSSYGFDSSVTIPFTIGNRRDSKVARDVGALTWSARSGTWEITVQVKRGVADVKIETVEVPEWMLDLVDDEAKARIVTIKIKNSQKPEGDDDDLPF